MATWVISRALVRTRCGSIFAASARVDPLGQTLSSRTISCLALNDRPRPAADHLLGCRSHSNTTNGSPSIWSAASPRELASLEDDILSSLRSTVVDPFLHKDIVTLGWVRGVSFPRPLGDDEPVRVTIRLPTLLHPSIDEMKSKIRLVVWRGLENLAVAKGWSLSDQSNIDVAVFASKPVPLAQTAAEHSETIKKLGPGLANVGHFLAVYSCKGGVGKSTIAANLAYELSNQGARVGLLDVDIYGPSLPLLVKPLDPAVRRSPKGSGMVYPIIHSNVKLMSLGYVSPNSGVPGSGASGGPAVMRGPMAGRVVAQLLKGTDWGDLDVLILDLPPGTGDVQLEVCQSVRLSGAVCVTTPSKLAVADAIKGVEMFAALGVPTLATVENMAYFDCEGGGRHHPFGEGLVDVSRSTFDGDSLSLESVGIDLDSIIQLPISSITNGSNDSGTPLCLERPCEGQVELVQFERLARNVSEELLLLQHGKSKRRDTGAEGGLSDAVVTFDNGGDQQFDVASLFMAVDSEGEAFSVRLFSGEGAWQGSIRGDDLRSVDPKTGEKMATESAGYEVVGKGCGSSVVDDVVTHHKGQEMNIKPELFPARVEKKGIYGYSVEWADGATIIYSMISIAKAAGGKHVSNL